MRIRIAAVTTVVVIAAWVPSSAHALCGQIYTDAGVDLGYGFVWGETDVWFAESNVYYLAPMWSCGQAMSYAGGSAKYRAALIVQGPLVSVPDWHDWNDWWAHAYAEAWIEQAGFGWYWIHGSGEEYLCLGDPPDPAHCPTYTDLINPPLPVWVPYPSLAISASDYTPALNSGPVQVWAQLDPYGADPAPIQWSGCLPQSGQNAVC